MKFSTSAILALPTLAAATCHHGTSLWRRQQESEPPQFTYEGETGPLAWATLDESYVACANGTRQSPANLVEGDTIRLITGDQVTLNLPNLYEGAEFENLGTTLEVIMEGETHWISYNGINGTLLQYHFHTPSEHHINSEYYPMEVHFVFDAGDNGIIVLGVPIEVDHYDDLLLRFTFANVAEITTPETTTTTGPLYFDGLTMHVGRNMIWTYAGSLTTPPCSEVVTWLVVNRALPISPKTYREVKTILGYNSRPTQNIPGEINILQFASEEIFA